MRTTSIELFTADGIEPIIFDLLSPSDDEHYLVKGITGLDAQDLVPKFYGNGQQGVNKFFDFVLKPREIVILVSLNPDALHGETYSDVRDRLYRAISTTRTGLITLMFKVGSTVVATIAGMITKFEAAHSVQVPEVQLTISCPDPILRAVEPLALDVVELNTTDPVIVYDPLSTSPHGFMMEVTFTAPEDFFNVQDVETDPDWFFKVDISGGFLVDDVLHISSDYGKHECYVTRGGVKTYLADRVYPGSNWPILFPGENSYWFTEIASWDWTAFEYYASYWGV